MLKMPNSDYYHVFMYWKRRRGYTDPDPKRTPEMVESITMKDIIFSVKIRRRTGNGGNLVI
jgi:hypothetical protein